MANKLAVSSALSTIFAPSTKIFCPSFQPHVLCSPRRRANHVKISAKLGGGEEEEAKKGGKRKFITREEEPEQQQGKGEGENPMKTPLPYIIIFGMSTPFVILAIAFANGWVKVPVR